MSQIFGICLPGLNPSRMSVVALATYQTNHVWAVIFNRTEATRMLASGDHEVKERRWHIIEPQSQQVRWELHWLLQEIDDEDVRMALTAFGKVTEVIEER